MKPLPDSLQTSNLSELKFSNSEPSLPSFDNSIPTMSSTMNIPENLMNQAPLSMESLMKGIGTSSESEETEEKPKKQDRFSKMEEGFCEQFVGLGVLVAQFHEADGLVLINRADPLSKRLVGVARQNPAVYKALKKYLDGSVWMMLTEEVAAIGLAIMANHGINPVGALIEKFKGKKDAGNDQLQPVA